jgi:hypothetical protein
LALGFAKGNVLTVADIGAKRIEIAIKEPTFTLVDQINGFGFIRGYGVYCPSLWLEIWFRYEFPFDQ